MVEPAALAFEAGQWVSVPFGPKIVRAYSMASPPARRRPHALRSTSRPGGIGSQWFRGLAPGDRGAVQGADSAASCSTAPIRGGRSSWPRRSASCRSARSWPTSTRPASAGPPRSIYWARNPGWLVYDADFRSLARRYPGFSYLPVLREPPATWRGEKGEPAEAVDRLVYGVDKLVVYVCGGGETINKVRDVLVAKGMDRKSVKWEKFW